MLLVQIFIYKIKACIGDVIDASLKTGGHASLNFENVRVLLCLSGGVFQIHNLDALKEGFQGICARGQEK